MPTATRAATHPRRAVRQGFLPFIALTVIGVVAAAAQGRHLLALGVVAVAVVGSFLAERAAPYGPRWNIDHDDWRRDVAHAVVNESLIVATVAALPLLAGKLTLVDLWPTGWWFPLQVVVAVVVFDAGVTTVHWFSHRNGVLWSFHAVHHSVTRFYGLNGLMKHPAGSRRPVISADMGVAGQPDYPNDYLSQLTQPFRGLRSAYAAPKSTQPSA